MPAAHQMQIKPGVATKPGYVTAIRNHDINFGIGPAEHWQPIWPSACAVEALTREDVQRILLVRPAVEAGGARLYRETLPKVDPTCALL